MTLNDTIHKTTADESQLDEAQIDETQVLVNTIPGAFPVEVHTEAEIYFTMVDPKDIAFAQKVKTPVLERVSNIIDTLQHKFVGTRIYWGLNQLLIGNAELEVHPREMAERMIDEREAVRKQYQKLCEMTFNTTHSMVKIIFEESKSDGTTTLIDNMRVWAMFYWAHTIDESCKPPIGLTPPTSALQKRLQDMIKNTTIMMVEFALVEGANGIHGYDLKLTLSEEMKSWFDLAWEQHCSRLSGILRRKPLNKQQQLGN
jgi:hypothetical protein